MKKIYFLALMAVLFMGFVVLASCGDDDDDDSGDDDVSDDDNGDDDDSNLPAGWMEMDSGTDANLHGIWGNSGNDIYVFGDTYGMGEDVTEKFILLHYDGANWNELAYGEGEDAIVSCWSMWGSQNGHLYMGSSQGRIFHWDGNSFSKMEIDWEYADEAIVAGIWGSSENDIWAAGSCDECGETYNRYAVVFHYDGNGSTWETVELHSSNTDWQRAGPIWGSNSDEIMAIGEVGDSFASWAYDGDSWTAIEEDFEADLENQNIWGYSFDDIWAVAGDFNVAHFDGDGWSVNYTTEDGDWLGHIWGPNPDNIFLLGWSYNWGDDEESFILHKNNGTWQEINRLENHLSGLWGTSENNIFFVGANGLILHYGGPEE